MKLMTFRGCCSTPHGRTLLVGLLLASISAMAATLYAFMSCRFVFVDFQSKLGGFPELFTNGGAGAYYSSYRISAGLFNWLKPYDELDYTQGQCAGYTVAQTDGFGDKTFYAVQYLVVTSVLMSIALIIWIIFMACFTLGKCQAKTMSVILFVQCILVGLSFLTLQSGLCQDVGEGTSCKLADSGLVAVAAVILWFVAFLISCCFSGSVTDDLVVIDGELYSRRKLKEIEKRVAEESDEEYSVSSSMQTPIGRSKNEVMTPETMPVVEAESGEGEMEVYYVKRVDQDPTDTVDL